MSRTAVLATIAVLLAAGCAGGPVLANPPAARPAPAATASPSARPPDPVPIVFPRDDAPHDRLTEWWYYTGHLRDAATGDRYGFEFVVFRAERGDFPVSWASHLAITDETARSVPVRPADRDRAEAPTSDRRPVASTWPSCPTRAVPPTARTRPGG